MEDGGMHVRHSVLMRQVTGGLAIDGNDKRFDGAQVLAAVEATRRARSKATRRARSECIRPVVRTARRRIGHAAGRELELEVLLSVVVGT